MVRGAIEIATPTVVSGWLYCNLRSLNGHAVLAFVGTQCVGSGRVSIFRKDLLDAGLGDGICGFHFNVALSRSVEAGSIVVRLESSDLSLLQSASIVTRDETANARARSLNSVAVN